MLVVEDGTIRDGTVDAYTSIADADAFIARWHNDTAWSGATDAEKERSILRATRFVDTYKFMGQRTDPDQALAWPRAWIGAIDGKVIASNEIPREIKEATIEAAMRDNNGESLFVDHDGGTIKRQRRKVGELETETEFGSGRQAGKTFDVIEAMIRPFLQANRGLQRSL